MEDVRRRRAELELQWALEDHPWIADVLRRRTETHHADGSVSIHVVVEPRPDGWAGIHRIERVMRAYGAAALWTERTPGPVR